ncbi:iron ABC transporter permease [Corynebacterium pseudodiphtheriticum]|uniref:FecCD family ABC transporter permease n=1 Tax=Corynebacterium pseudodiphtheriticum TaxID=37637 RepID=UPI00254B8DF8|nr:iron ABC transporter permease [Corynebacterium pseudodiphtheriticum]MDK8552118.1 iron ABC transporter permease [Corynebacterium pseudodiphtheriticum]
MTRISFLPATVLAVAVLGVAIAASLFFGSNNISPGQVWASLSNNGDTTTDTLVLQQRLPRTIVVVLVGAALGVAGALMQALTRNPLADPGILGINAGASIAVVAGVAFAGVQGINNYILLAIVGALLASIMVYLLGGAGRNSVPSPARLTLAGVAISMAISSLVQAIILSNANAFNEFRYWAAGSVEGRGWPVLEHIWVFIVLGLVFAFASAPSLNALSLGEEMGTALGVKVWRTRVLTFSAITILAGTATAAVGPLMFVGLAVPYAARGLFGHDNRAILAGSVVIGPVFLLAADVLARLVIMPQEVQTGLLSAVLGGPIFIAVVRMKKIGAV